MTHHLGQMYYTIQWHINRGKCIILYNGTSFRANVLYYTMAHHLGQMYYTVQWHIIWGKCIILYNGTSFGANVLYYTMAHHLGQMYYTIEWHIICDLCRTGHAFAPAISYFLIFVSIACPVMRFCQCIYTPYTLPSQCMLCKRPFCRHLDRHLVRYTLSVVFYYFPPLTFVTNLYIRYLYNSVLGR